MGYEMIKIAETREEFVACHSVVHELRTHRALEEYLEMLEVGKAEGYRLVYLQVEGEVVACAGFHIQTTLFLGKYMYVDDLVTAEKQRSKRYGEKMLDWLKVYARNEGCENLTLCSGVQRFDAHRFYLNQGFKIASHYFSQEL